MSRTISLNGEWVLHFGPQVARASLMTQPEIPAGFGKIAARVPGNVELDMVRAGLLPEDLACGDNIYRLKPLETQQYWYSRRFEVDDAAELGRAVLVLRGVDNFASIWVNGYRLGSTDNMLIPHELPLGGLLRDGENEIVVGIDSAVLEVHGEPVAAGSWAMENNWESLRVRKPPHAYGWDIMPRATTAGLWRDISIEARYEPRFEGVYLATLAVDAAAGTARLLVRWSLVLAEPPAVPFTVVLRVTEARSGTQVHEGRIRSLGGHGEFVEALSGIHPWWPKGYGAAHLYDVELLTLDEAGSVLARWQERFGFRTVTLRNSGIIDNDGGGEFRFLVNGVEIFIKGSNWVPLDAFHSRDVERVEETLALAVELNCNMLRCWGGNVYEDRRFFETCNREGMMVWQDFSLACAIYPQDEAFLGAMKREAEAIVPLFRNHPSLVLWAGNNEIDQTYGFASPNVDPNVDDRISREVLPEVCRRLDPYRVYLPSSPYYGPQVWERGDLLACPEDHLWGPRDDFKGPFYTGHRALFASEIGYHGSPARASLERMMRPEQLWPWHDSEDWLTHAVRPQPESTKYNYRIPLMATQIEVLFGAVPVALNEYVLASQISQAEALKFFIEMFRIEKGRRSGILWWNIRDGWPEISDAVVDYYGSRKLAFVAAQRAQSDILVMLGEPAEGRQRVVVVNDTAVSATIDIAVSCSDEVRFDARGVNVPANGRLELGSIAASDGFRLLDIAWRGEQVAGCNHYLGGSRPFDLARVIGIYRELLGDALVDGQIASRN